MRKGVNPAKVKDNIVKTDCFHQVIVPVHLPNLEGYYKEGLDILRLCLESIYLTVHSRTYISVVNNGSCQEVITYLDKLLALGKVNEVIHTTAIGKINAIAKGLAGHNFDLVTITDADVLFINGWQKAVYDIYEVFPKAGMVGTTPQPNLYKSYNEMFIFDNLLNSRLKFIEINNQLHDDILLFQNSINHKSSLKTKQLKKTLSITQDNKTALAGTGHFTATYKKEILNIFKKSTSKSKIGGDAMRKYIDNPAARYGHWRLCTYQNFTYHMGNVKETWMFEKLDILKNNFQTFKLQKPELKSYKSKLPVFIIRGLTRKFLIRIFLLKFFLKAKGLTSYDIEQL